MPPSLPWILGRSARAPRRCSPWRLSARPRIGAFHIAPNYGTHKTALIKRWLAKHAYLVIHNEHPKPFIWTKTADQILANVARFCQRTLEPR